jgi:hypothetical protein
VARGGAWVRLAHPAIDDFTPWRPWLAIDPGVSAVLDPKAEPEQTITALTLESSAGDLGVSSDLPQVSRS